MLWLWTPLVSSILDSRMSTCPKTIIFSSTKQTLRISPNLSWHILIGVNYFHVSKKSSSSCKKGCWIQYLEKPLMVKSGFFVFSWSEVRRLNDMLFQLERSFLYDLGVGDRKYIKWVMRKSIMWYASITEYTMAIIRCVYAFKYNPQPLFYLAAWQGYFWSIFSHVNDWLKKIWIPSFLFCTIATHLFLSLQTRGLRPCCDRFIC